MEKVKGLRRSIVLYILAFLLLAMALMGGTAFLCQKGIEAIHAGYPMAWEKYYLTSESGERLGDGAYISREDSPLSEADQRRVQVLEALPMLTTPLYSAGCILAAALLFYRNKLKQPLAALRTASESIARNDLDFTVAYTSADELGQLCRSFESMRSTLARNFDQMWRQMEERRRLNAAFAHDLRTPLTVLRGHQELLQGSPDPAVRQTAQTMGRHIRRIQQYVDGMSRLSRLEDTQPTLEEVRLSTLLDALREEAEALCTQKGLSLEVHCDTASSVLLLDPLFVTQVGENLLSNAVRFAESTVTLALEARENGLTLSVQDDGPGFTPQGLEKAAAPYFTEAREEHFGLGLYICKLLCERHGGRLELENWEVGARVTAVLAKSIDNSRCL